MIDNKHKIEIRKLFDSFYSKQYLYGYIACLYNYGEINLSLCEQLNTDVSCYRRK